MHPILSHEGGDRAADALDRLRCDPPGDVDEAQERVSVSRGNVGQGLREGGPLLATPVAGSILVLRTTGRTSGLVREAPLGHAVIGGRVVVVARYGRGALWLRNALADPRVEVLLPGALFAGRATAITDPAERRESFRTLIATMGVVGEFSWGGTGTYVTTVSWVILGAAGLAVAGRRRRSRP